MKTKTMNLLTWVLVSVILFGILLLWNSKVFGEDWTAEQKEVWVSVQGFWETIKKGDVEATLAGQHDNMLDWFSTYPDPLKKEYLREAYNNWFNWSVPTFFKLEPSNIHIFNNVANVFYFYSWKSANKEIFDKGRALEIWVKQDNKWLMIGSLSSSCDRIPTCPHGW